MKPNTFLLALFGWITILNPNATAQNSPASSPKLNVVDYFLRLPKETLKGSPKAWLLSAHVDRANGSLSSGGDGAQPYFEVVLFRFRDGTPLLALGQAQMEAETDHLMYLSFFKASGDGAIVEVKRSEFPEKDAKRYFFVLPRSDRTIVVRDDRNGRIVRKLTWNGEKFEAEK